MEIDREEYVDAAECPEYGELEKTPEPNLDARAESAPSEEGGMETAPVSLREAVVSARGGEGKDWELTYSEDGQYRIDLVEGKIYDAEGKLLTYEGYEGADVQESQNRMIEHFRANPDAPYVLPDWSHDGWIHTSVICRRDDGTTVTETWSHREEELEEESVRDQDEEIPDWEHDDPMAPESVPVMVIHLEDAWPAEETHEGQAVEEAPVSVGVDAVAEVGHEASFVQADAQDTQEPDAALSHERADIKTADTPDVPHASEDFEVARFVEPVEVAAVTTVAPSRMEVSEPAAKSLESINLPAAAPAEINESIPDPVLKDAVVSVPGDQAVFRERPTGTSGLRPQEQVSAVSEVTEIEVEAGIETANETAIVAEVVSEAGTEAAIANIRAIEVPLVNTERVVEEEVDEGEEMEEVAPSADASVEMSVRVAEYDGPYASSAPEAPSVDSILNVPKAVSEETKPEAQDAPAVRASAEPIGSPVPIESVEPAEHMEHAEAAREDEEVFKAIEDEDVEVMESAEPEEVEGPARKIDQVHVVAVSPRAAFRTDMGLEEDVPREGREMDLELQDEVSENDRGVSGGRPAVKATEERHGRTAFLEKEAMRRRVRSEVARRGGLLAWAFSVAAQSAKNSAPTTRNPGTDKGRRPVPALNGIVLRRTA